MKTTFTLTDAPGAHWRLLEDRVPIDTVSNVSRKGPDAIGKMLCFVQAPRYTKDGVCFVSNSLSLGEFKTVTMTKSQRKGVVQGVKMTEKQDIALAATLDSSKPICRRPILAIVASSMATCFAGVLGSIIFDIGKDAATTTVDDSLGKWKTSM